MAGGVDRIVIVDSDTDDAAPSSTKVLALPSVASGVVKWVSRCVPECKKGLLCSRTNISPFQKHGHPPSHSRHSDLGMTAGAGGHAHEQRPRHDSFATTSVAANMTPGKGTTMTDQETGTLPIASYFTKKPTQTSSTAACSPR